MQILVGFKVFLVMIAFAGLAPHTYARDFDDQVHDIFYGTVSAMQQRALRHGDHEIARLMQHPVVSLDWKSRFPSAGVYRDNRRARITVSAELVKWYYFFSELSVVGSNYGEEIAEKIIKCKYRYATYLRRQIGEHFEGSHFEGAYSYYYGPEEFAPHSFECRGIDSYIPLETRYKRYRDQIVGQSIAMVLLHEIGHVVKKHSGTPRISEEAIKSELLCKSRDEETEADEFAVRKLLEYGWGHAVFVNANWDVLLATASIVPAAELDSTHPSPSRRFVESTNYAVNIAPRYGVQLDPRLRPLARQLADVQSRIEEELAPIGIDMSKADPC